MKIKKPCQVFIGNSPLNDKRDNGNSILVRLNADREYIYIGHEVIKFKTSSEITHFYSPMGNNNVPNPYAICAYSKQLIAFSEDYLIIDMMRIKDKDIRNSFLNGGEEASQKEIDDCYGDPIYYCYSKDGNEHIPSDSLEFERLNPLYNE